MYEVLFGYYFNKPLSVKMFLLLVHSFSKLFIDTTTYTLIQYMTCITKVVVNIIIIIVIQNDNHAIIPDQ